MILASDWAVADKRVAEDGELSLSNASVHLLTTLSHEVFQVLTVDPGIGDRRHGVSLDPKPRLRRLIAKAIAALLTVVPYLVFRATVKPDPHSPASLSPIASWLDLAGY